MHFLSVDQCESWCEGRVDLVPARGPLPPARLPRFARVPVEVDFAFTAGLERALTPRDECLLWVTQSGIYRSSENLHLYYRLRQSYGDARQLHEGPGHLFHRYESADLISFLQLGILCAWDMHVIPSDGYARAFVSHDEFVDFAANDANPGLVDEFAAAHGGSRILSGTA